MGKKSTGKTPTDFEIGRGKPPRHTQYPPGKSGNPGGRKKESLNIKTLLQHVLASEIMLSDRGRSRKATMAEALILSAVKAALAGNQRAVEYLLNKAEALSEQKEAVSDQLAEEDEELLNAMLADRHSALAAGKANAKSGSEEREIHQHPSGNDEARSSSSRGNDEDNAS